MRLLLNAIRTLPQPDQDSVLALLLRGPASDATWQREVRRREALERVRVAATGSVMAVGGLAWDPDSTIPGSEPKVVPIRFPPRLYGEFKAWCEEHEFPMAAVVRGLVEGFLESRELPRPATAGRRPR